jgi:MEMO1 family protein
MREPFVAGQFYPASAAGIEKILKTLVDKSQKKEDALGAVMPHAGYVYSGAVAGATISAINVKPTCVILGPNHTGMGTAFSLLSSENWRTPLGEVGVDKKLCQALLSNTRFIKEDKLAHLEEHSIEVELPFLQYSAGTDFKIVPMVIASGDLAALKSVGKELAQAIRQEKKEGQVLIIASSDMTHYESQESAEEKDKSAIEAILKLDEDLLLKRVREKDITMCGYAPAIVMLAAAKELGATAARLVKYQTSGDESGDYSAVVGYAGIIVK